LALIKFAFCIGKNINARGFIPPLLDFQELDVQICSSIDHDSQCSANDG